MSDTTGLQMKGTRARLKAKTSTMDARLGMLPILEVSKHSLGQEFYSATMSAAPAVKNAIQCTHQDPYLMHSSPTPILHPFPTSSSHKASPNS